MATATYTAATARQIDLHDAVRQYRANERALRRLAFSRPTRNVAATERAVLRRTRDREAIELSLVLGCCVGLVGSLTEERKLNERLARSVGPRPELKARLTTIRRQIKTHLPV